MIEGLKFDVPSHVLRERFVTRRDYHEERAAFYATKIKALADVQSEIENEAGDAVNTAYFNNSNNPRPALEQSRRGHLAKRDLYAFLAEHTIQSETYRLKAEDLHLLEIT